MANAAATACTNTSTNESDSNEMNDTKTDLDEFVRIGRTGRRNAVADVNLDPNIHISAVHLTEMMRNINCGFEGSSA